MGFGIYSFSKMGNIYMTKYFQNNEIESAKLQENESQNQNYIVPLVSVHPGAVYTDLSGGFKTAGCFKCFVLILMIPFQLLFFKSEYVGAQTTLHCCYLSDQDIKKGSYYEDCRVKDESEDAKNEEKMKEVMAYTFKAIKSKALDFH